MRFSLERKMKAESSVLKLFFCSLSGCLPEVRLPLIRLLFFRHPLFWGNFAKTRCFHCKFLLQVHYCKFITAVVECLWLHVWRKRYRTGLFRDDMSIWWWFQLERISLICSLHLSLNSLSLAIIGFLFWSWYCFGQCMTNSLPRQKDYGHFTTIVGSKS